MTNDKDRSKSAGRLWLDVTLLATSIVLTVATILIALAPDQATLGSNPVAETVIFTATTVAGWLLAVVGWLRYRELGGVPHAFEGAAFVTLGLVYSYFLVIGVMVGQPPLEEQSSAAALLAYSAGELVMGGMLLIAAVAALRGTRRAGIVLRSLLLLGPAFFVGLVAVGLRWPELWTVTSDGAPQGLAPSDLSALLFELPVGVVFVLGALAYRRVYRRHRQPIQAGFSVALLVGAFMHAPFPVRDSAAYVAGISSDEILRGILCAIGLTTMVAQSGTDFRRIVRADQVIRTGDIQRHALEDRERLAREIHDGIAQDLWLTKLRYGQLRDSLPRDAKLENLAASVSDALEEAIGGTRNAISWMQADDVGTSPFVGTLEQLTTELSARFGIPIDVVAHGVPPLDPTVQVELMKIIQEALRNTLKHARATRASVAVRVVGKQLVVGINDDGDGFDSARLPVGTFGLSTMRRRSKVIGAELDIESLPGQGTRVIVRLALPSSGGGMPEPQASDPGAAGGGLLRTDSRTRSAES